MEDGEKPLFSCRVKYIGTSEPTEKVQGVEAVQEPLKNVYGCLDNDINKFTLNAIDCALTVLDNGLQLTFIADPSHVIVFPISSLYYCCTLRFCPYNAANQRVENPMFVFVDSDDANAISNAVHPPIFSAIFQRNRNKTCMECHSFVCQTSAAALQLVEACQTAYNKPQTDVLLKDSKYPYFYRYESEGGEMREIIEIPNNQSLSRINSRNEINNNDEDVKVPSTSSLHGAESFFYGTVATPIAEFAFNPDFLKRVNGYNQSLRRQASYETFGGGGGGVYVKSAGGIAPGRLPGKRSIIKRVVLKPGQLPPSMEPQPDYQADTIVRRKP
jgi:hypothetical protein